MMQKLLLVYRTFIETNNEKLKFGPKTIDFKLGAMNSRP